MFGRISKQPRPLSQRALPDLPDDSLGNSAVSSQKSISSAHDSNSSKLSHQSFTKNDDLFLMDRDGPEDHETYAVAADLSSIGSWWSNVCVGLMWFSGGGRANPLEMSRGRGSSVKLWPDLGWGKCFLCANVALGILCVHELCSCFPICMQRLLCVNLRLW